MKNEQGFSLVELLIVVAIIAIIAAIAVPSLLTSRMAANESSAIQGCRTVGSAEIAFSATNNQQYASIANLVAGNFLDSRFNNAANQINGYTYAEDQPVIGAPGATTVATGGFGIVATPGAAGLGRFSFGISVDQVVRYQAALNGASFPTGVVAGDPIGKTN